MSEVKVKSGNIFNETADAVVVPVNPLPLIGAGLDREFYRLTGETELLSTRCKSGKSKHGSLQIGDVIITSAFSYEKAKYLVHAVTPRYFNGSHEETEMLKKCYRDSLSLALSKDCKSIAFPVLSAGLQGFPFETALSIAEKTCKEYIKEHSCDITVRIIKLSAAARKKSFVVNDVNYYFGNSYNEAIVESYNEAMERYGIFSATVELTYFEDIKRAYDMRENDVKTKSSLKDFIKENTNKASLQNFLCDRIDIFLAKKHVNQSYISTQLGVQENVISDYKCGRRPISRKVLRELGVILELSYEDFKEMMSLGGYDFPIRDESKPNLEDNIYELAIEYCLKEAVLLFG